MDRRITVNAVRIFDIFDNILKIKDNFSRKFEGELLVEFL